MPAIQVLDLNRAADAASEASVAARFIVGDFNFCATDKKAWTENTVQVRWNCVFYFFLGLARTV